MFKRLQLFLPALPAFFLTGCITLYKPNVVNSPLLKEKGDGKVAADLGISGNGTYNLQGAYATGSHAGTMGNLMYFTRHSGNAKDSSGREVVNLFSAEAGEGYFTLLGEKKRWLFQCYGGGGYGASSDKIANTSHPQAPEVKSKFFNGFIQPGIARTWPDVDLSFDVRVNYVQIFDIHAYLYNEFAWWNTDFHYYNDTTLHFINIEPAITVQAGGKLRFISQIGLILPVYRTNDYMIANSSSMLIFPLIKVSAGICYTFGRKKE